MTFASIDDAIDSIKKGIPIIIMDDPDRENEGDIYLPAGALTLDMLNFMLDARGLLCTPITRERATQLNLPMMAEPRNGSCKFTVSVDYKTTESGISVPDRYATIKALIDQKSKPEDFKRPGHTFPLVAEPEGLRVRRGHTEASIELAKLAGYYPAGVICEMLRHDNGEMARLPYLEEFAEENRLKIITIADLAKHLGLPR